ncbi:hypothetical protein FQN57_000722 [Myotisia sp. PD_48]|nr:hypothetical protein FQN57_000722 [Myotisia sp. PD_48]
MAKPSESSASVSLTIPASEPALALDQLSKADAALLDWVEEHGGGLDSAIEIYRDGTGSACLRAHANHSSGVRKNTLIARCPIKVTLSRLNIANSVEGIPPHNFVYSQKFLNGLRNDCALAFFLLHQYLERENSYWEPYIATLPRCYELTSIIWYEEDDMEWLSGTDLFTARAHRLQLLRQQYDLGIAYLKDASNECVPSYSWELFCWAYTIIASRSFTSTVLFGYFKSHPDVQRHAGDEFQVLIPVVDFTNHRPLSKIEWRAENSEVGLLVRQQVEPGQEIYNNYGPLSNHQLMTTYGFCPIDNICDYRNFSIAGIHNVVTGGARTEQEILTLDENKNDGNYYALLNVFHPLCEASHTAEGTVFSSALLDAMVYAKANARGTGNIGGGKDGTQIDGAAYGQSHLIISTLSQGVIELAMHARRIRKEGILSKEAKTKKQKNAQTYHRTQLMIFQAAVFLGEWGLNRARIPEWVPVESENLLNRHLASVPEKYFDWPFRQRIREIITTRESIVKQCGELFLNEGVVVTLPQEVQDTVWSLIHDVLDICGPILDSSQLMFSAAAFTYAVFLCFCSAAKQNTAEVAAGSSEVLTSRLVQYIDFLFVHYPVPEEQVRWMLDEEPAEKLVCRLHDQVIESYLRNRRRFKRVEALVGPMEDWLSENWLKWAWLTVEQEAFPVARNPLAVVFGIESDGQDQLPKLAFDYHLYIPQLPTD